MAKAILHQFEKRKGKKKEHTDNENEPDFKDLPLLRPINTGGDNEDDTVLPDLKDLQDMIDNDGDNDGEKAGTDEEDIVNIFEMLTEEEKDHWKWEVRPLQSGLYNVSWYVDNYLQLTCFTIDMSHCLQSDQLPHSTAATVAFCSWTWSAHPISWALTPPWCIYLLELNIWSPGSLPQDGGVYWQVHKCSWIWSPGVWTDDGGVGVSKKIGQGPSDVSSYFP